MKFSASWLRTFVDPRLSSEELAHRLTMAGLEVEELETVAPAFADVAKAQCFQPGHRLEAETIIELRSIHIGGLVIGSRPQISTGGVAGHPLGLIPAEPLH